MELTPATRAVIYERARVNFRLRNDNAARNVAEKALILPDRGGIILDYSGAGAQSAQVRRA